MSFGEVRFTVSNLHADPVKITNVVLFIEERRDSETLLSSVPAGPVSEYFLFARVRDEDERIQVLPRHHLLKSGETDGFYLRIEAGEGVWLKLRLLLEWNVLGTPDRNHEESLPFVLDFPLRSPAEVLKLLDRRDGD